MTFEEYDALWAHNPTVRDLNPMLSKHAIYTVTTRSICEGIVDKTKTLDTYKDMPSDVYKVIEALYSEVLPTVLQYRLGLIDIEELPF